MRRRKTFSDTSVSYAAVGCTQSGDVMVFPPTGFRATHDECRLGSGAERFEVASAALMTWGVLRGAHLSAVQVVDGDATGYQGLLFTPFQAPLAPDTEPEEILYSAAGEPYLSAGQTIEVAGVFRPASGTQSYRIIYVIREPRRIGYAWGTLDSTPVTGEELFWVQWHEDDSVVLSVRTVTQIALGRRWALVTPIIRLRQWLTRRQYVRSLLPARAA